MHFNSEDSAHLQEFTEPVLDALLSVAELVTVGRGETVPIAAEGELADVMYIVESGCLDVILAEGLGEVNSLRRGALLGPLPIVTGARGSALVTARVRSKLYKVLPRDFFALCSQFAGVSHIVMRQLAARFVESMPHPPTPGPHVRSVIVFVLASQTACGNLLATVVEELRREFRSTGTVASSIDVSSHSVLTAGDGDVRALHEQLKSGRGNLTFILADAESLLLEEVIAIADRVVIVADEGSVPGPTPELLRKADLIHAGPVDLRLWDLAIDPVCLHRLEARPPFRSLARLARRLRGASVGLVLSGGGARAFAHLGVVAEIVDRGIVIDRIGSSSMGGFVGARIAMGESADEAANFFRRTVIDKKLFACPPEGIVALTAAYSGHLIEDLSIPFSCISTDLVKGDAVVHRYGSLKFALHAGMALPGLIPPVVDQGRVLIDGAVVDALPVERMIEEGGGPILACDVTGRSRRMQRWATEWSVSQQTQAPDPLDVAVQAMDIASVRTVTRGRALADVLFRPVIPGGTLAYNKFDAFIAAGRRHAAQVLDALPEGEEGIFPT